MKSFYEISRKSDKLQERGRGGEGGRGKKSTKLFAIELLHAKCLNNMDVIFSPLHDTKNLNQLYFMQPQAGKSLSIQRITVQGEIMITGI